MSSRRIASVFRRAEFTEAVTDRGVSVFAGMETRADPAAYQWHGLRRGGDPAKPRLLFQYAMSGTGIFAARAREERVPAGSAFMALVPSDHHYGLPAGGGPWTFFFLMMEHPDLSRRWRLPGAPVNLVAEIADDAPPLAESLALLSVVVRGAAADPWDLDVAVYRWWVAWERWTRFRGSTPGGRQSLLEATAASTLGALPRALDVPSVAALHGMSRTHFTHHFRKTTGLAPGTFMRDVRLDEAARRLRETRDGLARIAAGSGFADANHFCKAFRRRFGVSPGGYRRQRHGGSA